VNGAVRLPEDEADDPVAASPTVAEQLAIRAVARDPEAWSAIFEAHYRSVFAFVRYRLRGSDEAEDLAAQVFEVAYSRAAHFDYRGIPIEGWLIGIARNLVRDYLRKIGRRGYEEELLDSTAPTTVDNAVGVDLYQDLQLAMKSLTADQQTVLSLRFILDKSVADTAKLMNRSEDAVKNLQRRALAAMQRSLNATPYRSDRSV
jgi:RNA polymerase sigma-70 factor (ECF subfamily)